MDFKERFKGRTNFVSKQGFIQDIHPVGSSNNQTQFNSPEKKERQATLGQVAGVPGSTRNNTQGNGNRVSHTTRKVPPSQQNNLVGDTIPNIMPTNEQLQNHPGQYGIEGNNDRLNKNQSDGHLLGVVSQNQGNPGGPQRLGGPYFDSETEAFKLNQAWIPQMKMSRAHLQQSMIKRLSNDQPPISGHQEFGSRDIPRFRQQQQHVNSKGYVDSTPLIVHEKQLPLISPYRVSDKAMQDAHNYNGPIIKRQKSVNQILSFHHQEPSLVNSSENSKKMTEVQHQNLTFAKPLNGEEVKSDLENPQEPLDSSPSKLEKSNSRMRNQAVQSLREQLQKRLKQQNQFAPFKACKQSLPQPQATAVLIETNSMILSEGESDHYPTHGDGGAQLYSRQRQTGGRLGGKLQARSYNNQYNQQRYKGDYGQQENPDPRIGINMSLESYDFNNSNQVATDQGEIVIVARKSRQNLSHLQNKNKINRLKRVGAELIDQVTSIQGGRLNIHQSQLLQLSQDHVADTMAKSRKKSDDLNDERQSSRFKLFPMIQSSPRQNHQVERTPMVQQILILDNREAGPNGVSSRQGARPRKTIPVNQQNYAKIKQIIAKNPINALNTADSTSQKKRFENGSAYEDPRNAQKSRLTSIQNTSVNYQTKEQTIEVTLNSQVKDDSTPVFGSPVLKIKRSGSSHRVEQNQENNELRNGSISSRQDAMSGIAVTQSLPNLQNVGSGKRSYHDLFSEKKQRDILQQIIKMQVNQIERPKPPSSMQIANKPFNNQQFQQPGPTAIQQTMQIQP